MKCSWDNCNEIGLVIHSSEGEMPPLSPELLAAIEEAGGYDNLIAQVFEQIEKSNL